MARDFDQDPYDRSEHRVASWLAKTGVGGGDDPIGFLIASHEIWRKRFQAADVVEPRQSFWYKIQEYFTGGK